MIARYVLSVIFIALLGCRGIAAETFRDCADCPIMVNLPPGTFTMGAPPSETTRERVPNEFAARERPQHSVTIAANFALGQYAVTRGEFAVFVSETGYEPGGRCLSTTTDGQVVVGSWRNPGFAQTDTHPVVCVTFWDAQRYVRWLSLKTGKSYRLPTEAEWEYAARAGTTTARFWGDRGDLACDFANVADLTAAEELNFETDEQHVFQCRDHYVYTAPVGSFRPNAFGLSDMLGNVWQWVEDCFHESYDDAPSDGSAWTSGDCKDRILRGASWFVYPRLVRSAVRVRFNPDSRANKIGFRVAATLTP